MISNPFVSLLLEDKFTKACSLAVNSFNGKHYCLNIITRLEYELAGVIRLEVLEQFHYLGFFDLIQCD
jgi:hypothetical protein